MIRGPLSTWMSMSASPVLITRLPPADGGGVISETRGRNSSHRHRVPLQLHRQARPTPGRGRERGASRDRFPAPQTTAPPDRGQSLAAIQRAEAEDQIK